MSTFPGKLDEVPGVSVDRFVEDNLRSKAFFLSHFHSDHMEGLRSKSMRSVLEEQENVFLHCSEVTALFLSNNHLMGLSHKVRILPLNKPYTVSLSGLECVTVTALSAGHCPGSVMFLFQYKSRNVLYSGDLRLTGDAILKMNGLKDSDGALLPIETLYLDTTFYHPKYNYLPSRDESMRELINMCRSWLDAGKNHLIDLRTPATVGVEYVLIKLHEVFQQSVHVSDRMYEEYVRIPELAPAITKNKNSRFHACVPGNSLNGSATFLKRHPNLETFEVLSVKLCSLSAVYLTRGQKISNYSSKQDLHRVVYSSHSSHSELIEMIEILKPSKIVPCVVKSNENSCDIVKCLVSKDQSLIDRSNSDSFSPIPFSLSEDFANSDTEEDDKNDELVEDLTKPAHLTLSKYNLEESSDEALSTDETDVNELPPFRWDCYFDATKILGYSYNKKRNSSNKRQKLERL